MTARAGRAILAQQLGARVGLEDVSLDRTCPTRLRWGLGKYLSPRNLCSYGISLAESITR